MRGLYYFKYFDVILEDGIWYYNKESIALR